MAPLNAGLFLEAERQLLQAIRPRHRVSVLRPQVALSSGATYALEPPCPSGGQPSFLRPPGFDAMRWYRNINLFSIAYAFRPRLRARLTPGGLTSPGKPWAYGERVSHPFYRYSYRHQLSQNLHHSFRYGFDGAAMLPYHRTTSEEIMQSEASVRCLSPVSFSAQPRLTSELLRFLQRMAASKPTS
jgi:hypothetical protein